MLTTKFNYQPISRENIDGKRHYALPDGSKVASVTTVLDRTKPEEKKQALENWRKSVGEKRAQEITTEAAGRGTRMHSFLEHYVKNGSLNAAGTNPYSQQSNKMADIIIQNGLLHATEFWGTEVPVYYSGLYAGSTDLAGMWKGNESIMDFKQTNKPKKREWIEDYFLQLAAYAQAHNKMFGTNIRHGVILMCSKDFEYQEFVIEGDEFDYWTNKWWDRVEQYYSQY